MLQQEITAYIVERLEALVARFFPGWQMPGFFGGFRVNPNDASDFLYVLTYLNQLGVKEVAGTTIAEAMRAMLRQVDGEKAETFWSYRIAEALLEFGPFGGNPLLDGMTPAERGNLREACDSTHIYDPAGDRLKTAPNNYWGVLARCENARHRLELISDTTLLDRCLAHAYHLMFANEHGYFDDSENCYGRYDIYSPDVHLFLEPMWDRFDQAKLRRNLAAQVRLVEKAAMENGACIAWGRSIGALSVCMTAEMSATALHLGLAADPERSLGLVRHAFDKFRTEWMADDLISAHRYKHTFKYRGPHRLVQMTIDCLGKWGYVATMLNSLSPSPGIPGEGGVRVLPGRGPITESTEPSPYPLPEYRERNKEALYPPIDELIRFDDRGAGVWLFRNDKLAFQLPVTSNATADYVPWLHSPGLFENPVDSEMIAGVPRVATAAGVYTIGGPALGIEKTPNGITLKYERFLAVAKPQDQTLPGRAEIRYRIEGDAVHGEIAMTFDAPPAAVTFDIPEAARPLFVKADTGHYSVVNLEGSPTFRSFWGEIRRWHQVSLTPAKSMSFKFTIRPAIRVTHTPADHDYNRSLFNVMPAGEVVERGPGNGTCIRTLDVGRYLGDSDILHIGWPEHMFNPHGLSDEDFDKRLVEFIEKVGRSGKKIVWTMHNRIPHAWPHERGRALYRAWAAAVDGVIHHSRCGMELMRQELPYKSTAKHVVIPHGHFGAMMPKLDRAALEAKYGLTPCAMRFGLLGRPQKEKQFELVVRAFIAAGREDQQLVITAGPNDPVIDHPRVKVLIKGGFLRRDQINEHSQLVDVQVCAHTGETYLTSGMPADAIALGQAMFVPEWAYFREHLGDAAVYHDNSEATLTELFRTFTPAQMRAKQAAMASLQDQYAWPRLAQMTLDLYRSL